MNWKALLVLLAAIAFAISPFLNPEFGGFDPGRYPIPQINPPVQPAGYAFAIWGLIYLWLLIHSALGLWRYGSDADWDQTRAPLLLSLCVGMFWLPVALISPIWATVMIWIMLAGAVMAMIRAGSGAPEWALQLPLGLYAGWLSAASFVSTGLLGAGYGIIMGEIGWAVLALVLAMGFAAMVQHRCPGNWTYGAAVAWGFAAIAVANLGAVPMVVAFASVAALLMAGLAWREIGR